MAATSAEYLASMAEAIRGFEDDEIVLEALRDTDQALWAIAEEAAEDTATEHAATLRARTEATP